MRWIRSMYRACYHNDQGHHLATKAEQSTKIAKIAQFPRIWGEQTKSEQAKVSNCKVVLKTGLGSQLYIPKIYLPKTLPGTFIFNGARAAVPYFGAVSCKASINISGCKAPTAQGPYMSIISWRICNLPIFSQKEMWHCRFGTGNGHSFQVSPWESNGICITISDTFLVWQSQTWAAQHVVIASFPKTIYYSALSISGSLIQIQLLHFFLLKLNDSLQMKNMFCLQKNMRNLFDRIGTCPKTLDSIPYITRNKILAKLGQRLIWREFEDGWDWWSECLIPNLFDSSTRTQHPSQFDGPPTKNLSQCDHCKAQQAEAANACTGDSFVKETSRVMRCTFSTEIINLSFIDYLSPPVTQCCHLQKKLTWKADVEFLLFLNSSEFSQISNPELLHIPNTVILYNTY